MRPLVAHCHHGLGRLYGQTGRGAQARVALTAAIELYRAMSMTFWLPQAEAALAQVESTPWLPKEILEYASARLLIAEEIIETYTCQVHPTYQSLHEHAWSLLHLALQWCVHDGGRCTMAIAGLHLTEQEQTALESMAQRTGKTPDELVHDAIKQFIAQFQAEDRLSLLRQARGMWKDRTDLPSLADLRREWDRPTELNDGDTTAD
jgi:hypothetical protein